MCGGWGGVGKSLDGTCWTGLSEGYICILTDL